MRTTSVIYTRRFCQDPCSKHGDAKTGTPFIFTISVVYTRRFCQDPCIETWIFSTDADNFRDLYTQILSRSVFRNTEMQKQALLLFLQLPWIIHADFVKIHVPKHGDAKTGAPFIFTASVVYTRRFCQDPCSETRRCKNRRSSYFYNIRKLYTRYFCLFFGRRLLHPLFRFIKAEFFLARAFFTLPI